MTESDWEDLEEEILTLLSDAGISAIVEEVEQVTIKYILAIRRLYKKANETSDDCDD